MFWAWKTESNDTDSHPSSNAGFKLLGVTNAQEAGNVGLPVTRNLYQMLEPLSRRVSLSVSPQ